MLPLQGVWLTTFQHGARFVQFFRWYESDDYIHIAMEYVSHGHLRNYLEMERPESEAKVLIRQLLEGLVIIHQEGLAHRDLKPEAGPSSPPRCEHLADRIHRTSSLPPTPPIWVKIGDFGLAKLAGTDTAFRTEGVHGDGEGRKLGGITEEEEEEDEEGWKGRWRSEAEEEGVFGPMENIWPVWLQRG